MKKLVLETKTQKDKTPVLSDGRNTAMITPAIDEEYWLYRVSLGGGQSVVGFPKFGTIGIGFAKEKDWNTNLPYTSSAKDIYAHIKHNAGRARATRSEIVAAIQMIREAARADMLRGSDPMEKVNAIAAFDDTGDGQEHRWAWRDELLALVRERVIDIKDTERLKTEFERLRAAA